jgi:hypothetical protein
MNARKALWVLCLLSTAAHAEFYRFIDENGVVVISRSLPPDAASRGYEVLADDGMVLEEIEGQPMGEEREAWLSAREAARALSNRDRNLLLRYVSEADLEARRTRKLGTFDDQIATMKAELAGLAIKKKDATARAARLERDGAPVPEALQQEIQALDDRIVTVGNNLENLKKARASASAQFDEDLARFRLIKPSQPE